MTITECRICTTPLRDIHTFGEVCPVNAFYDTETKYPLGLVYCPECELVQLSESIDLSAHFSEYYQQSKIAYPPYIIEGYFQEGIRLLTPEDTSYVMEIGCNDGYLLERYLEAEIKVLGVDPAVNLVEKALSNGVNAIPGCFNETMAQYILNTHGKTPLIHSHHMLAHMDNPLSLIEGIKTLLAPGGTAIIDVQYLISVLDDGVLDNIYHEHIMFYTFNSLNKLLNRAGLTIAQAKLSPTSGGTLCAQVKHSNEVKAVDAGPWTELEAGKYNNIPYLRERCEVLQTHINNFREYIENNGRMYGYGAAARATIFLNLAGINEFIYTIYDDVPEKWDKLLPGTMIGICTSEFLNLPGASEDDTPIIVFPWHAIDKIVAKWPAHKHRFVSLRDIYLGKVR